MEDVLVQVHAEHAAARVAAVRRTRTTPLRTRAAQPRRYAQLVEHARQRQLPLEVCEVERGARAGRFGFGSVRQPAAQGCATENTEQADFRIRLTNSVSTKVPINSGLAASRIRRYTSGLCSFFTPVTLPRSRFMPQKSPWHSIKEQVHHNNTACTEGNNIEKENRREGTGNKRLCERCAELNRQGK